MITNFEEITAPLTTDEKAIIKLLMSLFNKTKKDNPVKSYKLVDDINSLKHFIGIKNEISGVTIRKLVNLIRRNGLFPVIATSKGYYVSYEKEEVAKAVKSLQERAQAIEQASFGLEKFAI